MLVGRVRRFRFSVIGWRIFHLAINYIGISDACGCDLHLIRLNLSQTLHFGKRNGVETLADILILLRNEGVYVCWLMWLDLVLQLFGPKAWLFGGFLGWSINTYLNNWLLLDSNVGLQGLHEFWRHYWWNHYAPWYGSLGRKTVCCRMFL